VNTKNRLRGLAGGGATPLASGLNLALETALRARSRGQTPTIALLTDGRANIALDGTADRPRADADAQCMARAIRGGAVPSILIDVAQRPQPALAELARQMAARYIALPRMNSGQLAGVLGAALEA
jgi:magnesium chelatase subunit D